MKTKSALTLSVLWNIWHRRWCCAAMIAAGALASSGAEPAVRQGHDHDHGHGSVSLAKALRPTATSDSLRAKLPPLPPGVAELKFSDFFVTPVGPRGLELTEKLRQLDRKRVRILGYMARQEQPVPGMFLFSAIPVQLNEEHYGLADDLPAATLFVAMSKDRDQVVRHTSELMLLIGTLSVGNREEADGRISTVRLALDPPQAGGK